jgi:hypothetical protein
MGFLPDDSLQTVSLRLFVVYIEVVVIELG